MSSHEVIEAHSELHCTLSMEGDRFSGETAAGQVP